MASSQTPFVPSEFSELPFGEQLVLWATRIWFQALRTETNAQGILRTCFLNARASEAYLALDDLLTILTISAQCGIDIRDPKSAQISSDENFFLGAIAAWQHQASASLADAFLINWMPVSAVRFSRTPTARLASALKDAGLIISCRKLTGPSVPIHIVEANDVIRALTIH